LKKRRHCTAGPFLFGCQVNNNIVIHMQYRPWPDGLA
jgi:hypothetical protein